MLCEYAGEVIGTLLTEIRDAEYQRNGFHSVYMFETEQAVIDATFIGNLGRFINHSCDPNAESEQIKPNSNYQVKFQQSRNLGNTQVSSIGVRLQTKRALTVGTEATQNYNMHRAPFDKKILCFCGAECCTGFMN